MNKETFEGCELYCAPVTEVFEMKPQSVLCTSDGGGMTEPYIPEQGGW